MIYFFIKLESGMILTKLARFNLKRLQWEAYDNSNSKQYFCPMGNFKEKYKKYKDFFPADLWAILIMILVVGTMLFIIL